MKTVIMAGGKGTRISSLVSDIPKPMIKILDKPILEHQIYCLKQQGLDDIILVIGHMGKCIKDYFKDGSDFGVSIKYYIEEEPLGTAGSLYYLKDDLKEDFILLNGDIIFDIDFKRFISFHLNNKALVSLFTHPNDHPFDSGIIVTDNNCRILEWLHKEDERSVYKNRVNAGIHILNRIVLNQLTAAKKTDLDREILKPLISSGKLFAYDSPEYVKDMGTPERYKSVTYDLTSGKVSAKNLGRKQKAIFLDRDGTINTYAGFITKQNQLELIDGVEEAIRGINSSGYLAIIISNQPVIARGECTVDELEIIHNKLETLLGQKGAYLDGVFYCPHHPDKGFEGERPEYKIKCNCRKPSPGMIYQAADKFNINLSESYMIGDSLTDVDAGIAAGCKTVLLNTDMETQKPNNTQIYPNLLQFVNNVILQNELLKT